MTIDILGFATLSAVLLLGAILTLYNSRQAKALFAAQKVLEDWFMLQVKDRREKKLNEIRIENPLIWLGQQVNMKIAGIYRYTENPKAVSLQTDQGSYVVVSPLDPEELNRALKPLETAKGRSANMIEPMLGRNLRKVKVIERNLVNAGEWFDVEAAQVGELINLHWGETPRLWFYLVPMK